MTRSSRSVSKHGLGDCRKPLAESATIIEEIVHHQMTKLLYQAEDVGRIRNARFLGIEDFLFLLRKDKVKLRRLIRYLGLKDMKAAVFKPSFEEEEGSESGEPKPPLKKRRKICYDFLSNLDQTGELVALFDDDGADETKRERALRAELQSRVMDAQQYIDFCEARQASFTPRYKSQKFKDWLMQGVAIDIKPNQLAMEILSYLAYETVAQVVDLSLLVKADSRGRAEDPFAQTLPPTCVNHDSFPPIQSQLQNQGLLTPLQIKSPPASSRAASPVNSPPSTPTTPSPAAGLSQSQSSLTTSGSSSKPKNKKKKKIGNAESRNIFTCDAIQPAEIREAIRRYHQCVGPFADFRKYPTETTMRRVLCC